MDCPLKAGSQFLGCDFEFGLNSIRSTSERKRAAASLRFSSRFST
jgi:hypothetical protein